tara:strand:- start:179 stop:427 length:249 start_codon:yes stop_codon:yes gene_type:complete
MIKLKKLHEGKHLQGCYDNYSHDSSKSLYGYKEYFIKTDYAYMGWNIYKREKQINPITPSNGMSFKQAREWLDNYLQEKGEI